MMRGLEQPAAGDVDAEVPVPEQDSVDALNKKLLELQTLLLDTKEGPQRDTMKEKMRALDDIIDKQSEAIRADNDVGAMNDQLQNLQREMLAAPKGPERDALCKQVREMDDRIEAKSIALRTKTIARARARGDYSNYAEDGMPAFGS
jgi:hypothetical protein